MSEMERCQRTAREAQDAQAQALKVIEEANSAAALRANYTARDLKRVEKERDDARRASLQLEVRRDLHHQRCSASSIANVDFATLFSGCIYSL